MGSASGRVPGARRIQELTLYDDRFGVIDRSRLIYQRRVRFGLENGLITDIAARRLRVPKADFNSMPREDVHVLRSCCRAELGPTDGSKRGRPSLAHARTPLLQAPTVAQIARERDSRISAPPHGQALGHHD